MYLGHVVELNPTVKQQKHFVSACGCARFAYNWALSEWEAMYKNGEKADQFKLRSKLRQIKCVEFPWMLNVTKCATENAIIDLQESYSKFFKKVCKQPKFRTKGRNDSFRIDGDKFKLDSSRIRIPKLGWVRMREALRFTGKVVNCTIKARGGKWFASFVVDTEPVLKPAENQGAVGIDLGLTTFATLSNGQKIAAPKPLAKLLPKLKRLSRALSRKQKGSKNREKARIKLARLHMRIWNVRQDFLHKLTSDLTRRYNTICVESLNVKGMLHNHKLARVISDVGWHEFRRQLEYKAEMRGTNLVFADVLYPSTRMCSSCGNVGERIALKKRLWKCPCCGAEHDRDLNAAINLRNLAVGHTVTACGEEGSGLRATLSETSFGEAGTYSNRFFGATA